MKKTDLARIEYPANISPSDKGFVRRFVNFIRDFVINKSLTNIVIAYSTGIDSTCLVDVCNKVQIITGNKVKFIAVYVNHGLRPEENIKEIETVRSLSGPITSTILNGKVEYGPNLEARARDIRYSALCNFARENNAVLFVAHNKDEDLETMLMRLFSNRYIINDDDQKFLYGIKSHSNINGIDIYRPFLNIPKKDLFKYLKILGIPWLEDSSNISVDYERNFMRHEIIPLIKSWKQKTKKDISWQTTHIEQHQK